MKFTTSCLVRIENLNKQKELAAWLKKIGYSVYFFEIDPNYVITEGSMSCAFFSRPRLEALDCGTSIRLFKALAAMNDENDYRQWFIGDAGMLLCPKSSFKRFTHENSNAMWDTSDFRKMTIDEIINYLGANNNDIKKR